MWMWSRHMLSEAADTATGNVTVTGVRRLTGALATSAGAGLLLGTNSILNVSGVTYVGFANR